MLPPGPFPAALGALVLALAGSPVLANEAAVEDEAIPDSVTESASKIESGISAEPEPPTPPRLGWRLRKYPFLADTRITFAPRTYYFDRNQEDSVERKAWAYGGALSYRSGWLREAFSVGATVYTTQKVLGPASQDGSKLLRARQHGFTVLGQAWARLRLRGHELTLGRQILDYPYLGKQDSRMIPNTHEGYQLRGTHGAFAYGVGYFTKFKARDDDDFVSMSEAAGVEGTSSKGLFVAGFRWEPRESLEVGGIELFVKDTLHTLYLESSWTRELTPELAVRVRVQFTDQRSVGRDLIEDDAFRTWGAGGLAAATWKGLSVHVAGNTVGSQARIRNPHGSYPGFTALMQQNFKRAGEDSLLVGATYAFGRHGLPGVKTYAVIGRGWGARSGDINGRGPVDATELNWTLDVKPERGLFENAWLRLRWSSVKYDGVGKWRNELRVIWNYRFSLL